MTANNKGGGHLTRGTEKLYAANINHESSTRRVYYFNYSFPVFRKGSRKKSYFLNSRAIKRGGGGGRDIKEKIFFFAI